MFKSKPQSDSVSLSKAVTLVSPGVVAQAEAASNSVSSPAEVRASNREVPEAAPLWLRRTDQLVVSVSLVFLLVLLTLHGLRLSRWGTASIEVTSLQPREVDYSLDINNASWVEWAQLDGIGEKLAKRIVADRDEHGPFRDANDVGRVRGIHVKLLESMKPFLRGGASVEAAQP